MIPQIDAKVLRAELDDVEQRRNLVFRRDQPQVSPLAGEPAPEVSPAPDADPSARMTQLGALFERSHGVRPFGVAFSGGGIRSATFNLGLLQGLANHGLLPYIDYLSTVSGGGYIGSWFHGLIRNHCGGDVRRAEAILSPTQNTVPASPEFDQVTFLRKYSNYLAPRPGLFSVDTWVIGSIWIRNVLLNQLILLPTLCGLVLVALFAGFLSQRRINTQWADVQSILAVVPLVLATLISAANLRSIVRHTTPEEARAARKRTSQSRLRVPWALFSKWAIGAGELAALCTFIAAVMIAVKAQPERADVQATANTFAAIFDEMPAFSFEGKDPRLWSLIALPFLFGPLQALGGFPECYQRLRRRPDGSVSAAAKVLSWVHVAWMMMLTAAVSFGLIYLVVTKLPIATTTIGSGSWIRIGFGPPLVSLCILTGGSLLVGLMGADYPDGGREWLARIGSLIALYATAWLGLFIIAVYGPFVVAWVLVNYAAIGISAISGWAVTTGLGVLAGRSGRTNGTERENEANRGVGSWSLSTIIAVAPTVFMIGYLLLLSTLVHVTVRHVSPVPYPQITWQGPPGDDSIAPNLSYIATFQHNYWDVLSAAKWGVFSPDPTAATGAIDWMLRVVRMGATRTTLAIGGLCLVVAWIASWRFNINEFSLHHFYKNRLVRCYLGASHTKERHADRLTGFDPHDDFPISSLVPPYTGPYAIVNTALNLNAGSELAQQERKATSFVFTPRFCGFQPLESRADREAVESHDIDPSGYRDTSAQAGTDGFGFMYPDGPRLGTVMAISGAAANPNAGYHTSGPMAFLLTVFDARLGWWVGNPRNPRSFFPRLFERVRTMTGLTEIAASPITTSRTSGPRSAWYYLFVELLGQTTSRSRYVNLSDGGHFENLGLYELVRRRCHYVIVGDAEEDPNMTFESLGGVIRKCRADFGVEIDIDPTPITLAANRLSRAHCVMGTIRYPENEHTQAPGLLLYLKSSLTGDEPTDVTQYHAANEAFPQQSTGDQFFSESQFESYRRLGLHVASVALDPVGAPAGTGEPDDLRTFFAKLQETLSPRGQYAQTSTRAVRGSDGETGNGAGAGDAGNAGNAGGEGRDRGDVVRGSDVGDAAVLGGDGAGTESA